jgi:2-methylcitrate dehydratase PrpD
MGEAMTLSRSLVRRWKALSLAAIPDDVCHHAVMHIIDACGVGVAASSLEQGLPYARYAEGLGAGPASLLNGMGGCALAEAALINGGLIHSLEYDDTHTASIVHGSAVLLPAALAAAQGVAATPQQMVAAYIKAYEVLIRMGIASRGGFQKHGFQITSVAGALVSALLACDLMGGDEETCVHAIGIALSQSSGVFEFLTNGSTVKSFHPGWSAHAGIIAARMACAGLQGPETAIEGTRGLYQAFMRDGDAAPRFAQMLQDFGREWHTRSLAIKFVPSCHYLHGFVEAAAEVMDSIDDVTMIDRIHVRIADATASIVCEPWSLKQNPQTGHAIRWSLPVIVALRMIEGRVDLDSFIHPPSQAVLDLAARIDWSALSPHHFPERFEAAMTVVLKDGRVLETYRPDVLGNASRPANDTMILEKFTANAGRTLSLQQSEAIVDFWMNYKKVFDFSALSRALDRHKKGE